MSDKEILDLLQEVGGGEGGDLGWEMYRSESGRGLRLWQRRGGVVRDVRTAIVEDAQRMLAKGSEP